MYTRGDKEMDSLSKFKTPIISAENPFSGKPTPELLMGEHGDLTIYYAPFDFINVQARLVICGITPGAQQMNLALNELRTQLLNGVSEKDALRAAKVHASFGGAMRPNLIKLMNYIGLNKTLSIADCNELFGSKSHLVHFTSALRYPVFKNGENYNGTPSMVKNSFLIEIMDKYLVEEVEQLGDDVIYLPLGEKVEQALVRLANKGHLKESQLLLGLPHPSGANNERISYFVGEKKNPSSQVNKAKHDNARINILNKVESIKMR